MFWNNFDKYNDYKEEEAFLKAKKDLFEQYKNGQINKDQYDIWLESLEIQKEEYELSKIKVTKWGIAIWILAWTVKWLANWIFAMSWSSVRIWKKNK